MGGQPLPRDCGHGDGSSCKGIVSSEVLPACQIDDWLWSEEDFDILVEDYLKPLRAQIRGLRRKAYDKWLPTVVYGADYD